MAETKTTRTRKPAEAKTEPETMAAAEAGAPKKRAARTAAAKEPGAVKAKRAPRKAKAPEPPKYRTGYVALIGRPNAGKSTLLNAMLGRKVAIVSDKPQTTRVSILGIKTTERGQIVFLDNPGIHKPLHALNRRMMNFVRSALETSDVICLLVDASVKFGHGDEFALEILKPVSKPVLLLLNKIDAVRKENVLPLIDRYKDLFPFADIIPISALKRDNLDVLEKVIFDHLPAADRIYSPEEVSDQSERFLLAEIVREKVLAHVEQELPFTTAVYIESVQRVEQEERNRPQRTRPMTHIRASIFVEKDNHRVILIGRGGTKIKQIGIEARQEIERLLGTKVYLDLRIRVRERWRDSEDVLDLIEGQRFIPAPGEARGGGDAETEEEEPAGGEHPSDEDDET